MKFFWILGILSILLFLQTTIFSLPLVLGGLLFFCVLYKEQWIFPVGFGMGILLDMLTFHPIGLTSIFFTILLGIVFLYERKFEIQSLTFITFVTFLASLVYGLLFHEPQIFLEAVMLAVFAGGIFFAIGVGDTTTFDVMQLRKN